MSTQSPVYVQGSGMTRFGEHYEASLLDLIQQAVESALADADRQKDEIEAVYIGNMLTGVTEGIQHLGSQINQIWGRTLPVYSFEAACASGGMALHTAWKDVQSGHYRRVLVVGAEKMTEHAPSLINQALMGATNQEEQMAGISFSGLYALIARAYLDAYALPEDILSWVPQLMHRQSVQNPLAQFQSVVPPEVIKRSRIVSSPLRLFDCAPMTDGAAAVVLGRETSSVSVTASSLATTTPSIAQRPSLTSFPSTVAAKTGLDLPEDWQDQLAVLEAHDCFSISLIIALEDLGLAERGKGGALVRTLFEADNPPFGLNPSGGLKACGHPVGATGVKQVHSVFQHLRNLPSGRLGLTHNLGGTGGTAVMHSLITS